MRLAILAALTLATAVHAGTPDAAGAAAKPVLTDIMPVTLHPGINKVPGFLPDGGAATIIEAWRGNGNAHGHHAFMVLTGPSEGNAVGLAPFADGERAADTISDDPFDGERVIGAVRFVRARLNGIPASLLVRADLETPGDRPLADHARATVTVFRLTANPDRIGPPLSFVQVARLRSEKRYCNAELALRDVLGVPLPADYAGANRTDGCFGE